MKYCEILFRKVYNPANLSIESNDIVVDIGACFGVFTLFAARKTKNTVFALEPHPENFELLSRNIQTNGFKNIVTYRVAISYRTASKKFYMTNIKEGSTLDNHNIFGTLNKYIEVPAISLSEFMDNNNLGRVDFLKIDVEGHEDAILMSTPRNYLSRIRKIAMEFHNVGQLKHEKIQKYMENIGFTTKLNWDSKSPFGYVYCWRR